MKIAIAGASGFVGQHLIAKLRETDEVIALGRSRVEVPGVQWRNTDLFSATSTRRALEGSDVAVYLVHSMMPSSRLFQGSFHDSDLLLADNFARACARHCVKRIVYLGGLVPEQGYVSRHLQSRREVEEVLAETQIPVTVLRAGMIVGSGGSSFEILRSLVRKLPFMILPRWTRSATQAIYVDDVVTVLSRACRDATLSGRTFDLVNGESLTYETLLREMARGLGLKRRMIHVPLASTEFSKLWVSVFGRASKELVSPLIDSLLCDLPQRPPDPAIATDIRYPTFRSMLAAALGQAELHAPRRRRAVASSVRSIQRLPALPQKNTRWIAEEYLRWLPRFFHTLIKVSVEGARVTFTVLGLPLLVLESIADPALPDRTKLHIVAGLLSRTQTTGWLEFRQVAAKRFTLAAIHEFVPALPWRIYVLTQAPVHLWVMKAFSRHLERASRTPSDVTDTNAS
jgi:uncharacterized protein YbjT (DUF2867 family)